MRTRVVARAAGVAGMLGLTTPAASRSRRPAGIPRRADAGGGAASRWAGASARRQQERRPRRQGAPENVDGGISDVSAFGGYAYLNAFSPGCVSNGGAGSGVHVVDIRNPASPRKVGFIPAHPNSFVGEGIHIVRADTPSFRGDILIHNNEKCNATQFAPRARPCGT